MGRAPVGRDRFGRPLGGAGPGGQRPGQPGPWAPKKKVAAAGKKSKKTEITTPAEHKRVVRMAETIAVADLAQKMGIKGKEVIKKLWDYIKKNKLQDAINRRLINADEKLKAYVYKYIKVMGDAPAYTARASARVTSP